MTYGSYVELIDGLLAKGRTTGSNQSEAYIHYAKLNRQRMKRLEKTTALLEPVFTAMAENRRKMIWLVITEGWCGDAAQNIPVIEKMAEVNELIETRYILRDENPMLMDRFLTNGTRSIPKLIALDAENLSVIGSWGPRPFAAQQLYNELKKEGDKETISESLQRWYNADKGISAQSELIELFNVSEQAADI